jgi:hypothetical protein
MLALRTVDQGTGAVLAADDICWQLFASSAISWVKGCRIVSLTQFIFEDTNPHHQR